MRVVARAPANIAIVKYMGKKDARVNLPANASLSMALDSLCTVVELLDAGSTHWVAVTPDAEIKGRELRVPSLDFAGVQKFEKHLGRVLEAAPGILREFDIQTRTTRGFEIRSANTFPTASGIASSASAFAALTLAGVAACAENSSEFERVWAARPELRRALARVSRQGSGSSCRSFEGPWVSWEGEQAVEASASMGPYVDLVLLVASGKKAVSSSNAHAAVLGSPLWQGRPERANARVRELQKALKDGVHSVLAQVAWQELWEMHSLFHTSPQPFSYWLPQSLEILQWLKPLVEEGLAEGSPEGPVVTMDAGPNVHLLVRAEFVYQWKTLISERFSGLQILEDAASRGAELISLS